MSIILDDVSFPIYILITGILLNYFRTRIPKAFDMMVTYSGADSGKSQ